MPDRNQIAKRVVDIATGQRPNDNPDFKGPFEIALEEKKGPEKPCVSACNSVDYKHVPTVEGSPKADIEPHP